MASNAEGSSTNEIQSLREELEATQEMAAKPKKAAAMAETKFKQLRFELRQSSNQEMGIQATAQKLVKALEDK